MTPCPKILPALASGLFLYSVTSLQLTPFTSLTDPLWVGPAATAFLLFGAAFGLLRVLFNRENFREGLLARHLGGIGCLLAYATFLGATAKEFPKLPPIQAVVPLLFLVPIHLGLASQTLNSYFSDLSKNFPPNQPLTRFFWLWIITCIVLYQASYPSGFLPK